MFHPEHPFDLEELPPNLEIQKHPKFIEFMELYHNAQKNISELNGALREIENPGLLLSSLYLLESQHSSAVENIYTTIESVLEDETKPEQERKVNNKEVIKYKEAIITGYKSMQEFGLSSRTIKAIHKKLKLSKGIPGEFRQRQNHLAHKTINDTVIIYTPPKITYLNTLLSNWENFVHKKDQVFFPLIRIALCHYQFEAIHPFEDGNGRTGRILMVLQLVLEKMLDFPTLFISGYLSQYDQQYKELLLNVTKKGEWWEFIQFMLKGFAVQALETKKFLSRLRNNRKELKDFLYNKDDLGIAKNNVTKVVDHIFYHPITHPKYMANSTKIHSQTCSRYLKAMSKAGLLKVHKSGKYKFYYNLQAFDSSIDKE